MASDELSELGAGSTSSLESPSAKRSGWRFRIPTILLGLAVIVVLASIVSPIISNVNRWKQHGALAVRVRNGIESLKSRGPADVPAAQWERAVEWTSNLISQVYFSPVESDPHSLRHLAEHLDEKLAGEVGLDTLRWVWDECEKAPRAGAEIAIRFRDVRLLTKEPITDADLPGLWSLDKCRYLELHDTQVTDEGIKSLQGRTNLKYLSLHRTQVTDEGVAKLQAALPECEISR